MLSCEKLTQTYVCSVHWHTVVQRGYEIHFPLNRLKNDTYLCASIPNWSLCAMRLEHETWDLSVSMTCAYWYHILRQFSSIRFPLTTIIIIGCRCVVCAVVWHMHDIHIHVIKKKYKLLWCALWAIAICTFQEIKCFFPFCRVEIHVNRQFRLTARIWRKKWRRIK